MQEIVDSITATDEGGQIAQSLLFPYLNHAANMYGAGYATAADIDAGMRFGCGYPIGPLALVDALGAATVVAGLEAQFAKTGDPLHQPAATLVEAANNGTSFTEAGGAGAEVPQIKREIKKVGVVGTGTMASGIAQVFAQSGYDVVFIGRSAEKLDGVLAYITKNLDRSVAKGKLDESGKSAILDRLIGSTEREALADVDIVVEAIAEDLDIKLDLFRDLDRICKPGAILATTTSSLSIKACADVTGRPADVIGMHFFNPAPIMKLVEVVTTEETAADVDETVRALCFGTGKHPVSCGDRAGFIVNALLFPYLNDAILLLESGAASMTEIDDAMKATKLPMGPFELLDVVGNDVSLAIQETLVGAFGHEGWAPAESLKQVVADGKLGRKTKAGFHTY
ncbi:MAG TPA: 3-hydroxyacyl-CoA dehydrogenase NAD-binding domain-containing protein [Aeromicrobium sp.]|nr:3-hydroxyacyl-CoA dehydrogenase NAD-binding domain-containing protein [Aeromicrobium sp.]